MPFLFSILKNNFRSIRFVDLIGETELAFTGGENHEVICIGCGKKPEELKEYSMDLRPGQTPTDYVRAEEGTYNPNNGHFLCTPCYSDAGMPSSPRGWVAP